MAIKISNQITITEHKKIIEIKEWYLATPDGKNVTHDTNGWDTAIPTIDNTNRYLWNYEEVVYSLGSSDTSEPVIIGVYGDVGASLQIKYISSITMPTIVDNNVSEWSDTVPTQQEGMNIYMTQKLSTEINWSDPIQISSMAAPTVEVIDGYWYINGESTKVPATGENGKTPVITINEDGYWVIDNHETTTKAEGEAGRDGASIEYVYYLSDKVEDSLQRPFYNNSNELPIGWSHSPRGIDEDNQYEYVSVRTKDIGEDWTEFSIPAIWSKWGERGQDGDGVAYEYYRCNESDVKKIPTWSDDNEDWKDNPQGVSAEYPYEYVTQLKIQTKDGVKSVSASDPKLWAKYSVDGSSLQIKYISSTSYPSIIDNDVSQWFDTVPAHRNGYRVYMTQKMSTEINWSAPIQISGTDGEANIAIDSDGFWVINGENTGVKAKGENGEAPEITIGENGYWYIDGQPTQTKAEGEAGKDGADIEYVYYRNNDGNTPNTPSYDVDNKLTENWFASPQGIDKDHMYEFVSVRTKKAGKADEVAWSVFSTPVIWSKWGEKGQDGDGVEYKYYLKNNSTVPTYSATDSKWTDDPTGVSIDNQYEYVIQIKTVNGVSTPAEKASLWAKYGANGTNGKGISGITNYYTTTTSADATPADWDTNVPALTPTNKYLWNYEEITYTDNSKTQTTAAIIGAYGDSGASGADLVDFQIYSVDGFEFNDNLTSITLKTVAIKGGIVISSGITYKWYWWNSLSDLSDKYELISDEASSSLVVNITDIYALTGLKCEITYDEVMYTDYVSLTEKTIFYTSVVKFFDGSNIFTSNDLYLVAYVDLYKNNERIESALDYANTYCTGVSTISSAGVITNNSLKGSFNDGDTMYFICQNGNGYDVVLGQHISNSWKKVDYNCKYAYINTLYANVNSNIIAISKESINKSRNIDFIIYDNNAALTRTNVNIIDSNDPIIGNQEPSNPSHNQLWLDTSVAPNVLKIYDHSEGKWLECADYNGNTVYTSKPSSYFKGDLWILADGEVCEIVNQDGELLHSFGPGSMLKATTTSSSFDSSHWADADEALTSLKDNINQYFVFNASTGLKIGQQDEKFYVNISSTEMGFYDNSNNQNQKVVSISNNAAEIKGLTVEDSAQFNCEVSFFGFVWKKEQNGSLSLAIGT